MSEQSKHGEPWSDEGPGVCDFREVRDARNQIVGIFSGPEARRRIVACVNACATLRTDALEAGDLDKALTALGWLVSGAADGREAMQARLDGIEALKVLGLLP